MFVFLIISKKSCVFKTKQQTITTNSYKSKDNLLDIHYYQSSFVAGFSVASISIESIDLYDSNFSNFLQFLSVLNQKTKLQLKTLAIKTVIKTTAKQFIFIFQKSNSLNNVVFILFNSFGYIS